MAAGTAEAVGSVAVAEGSVGSVVADPAVAGPAVTGRPLSKRAQARIARAVDLAERACGLQFCVYVGPGEADMRAQAEALLAETGLVARPAVLVLVAPPQRHFEIVTSPAAAGRLADRSCAMAAVSMSASFRVGDIAGGIAEGVRLMAQYAGPGDETGTELPDVLYAPAPTPTPTHHE